MMCRRRNKFKKVAALMALVVGGGMAIGCKRSPEGRIDHVSAKIASKLDFNDQQKNLLNAITTDMKKDFAEEKEFRKKGFGEIETLIVADQLDTQKIKALFKERQERMNQKVDRYVEKLAVLHNTLTPSQKKDLTDKLKMFRGDTE